MDDGKVVIRYVRKPAEENAEGLLRLFAMAFNFCDDGDDKEIYLLKEVIKKSFSDEGVTSKNLTSDLELPRTTIIYHLNRFINSGIVVRRGRKYFLRSEDMASTFEEVQQDMEREFNKLIEYAKKFDKMMEKGEKWQEKKTKMNLKSRESRSRQMKQK